MPGEVVFLVPDDLDAPTGGNRYDQRLLAALPRLRPATGAPLADVLAAVPDGGTVLLDGLLATPHPDVLAQHADRLRLVLLLHLLRADDDPPGAPLADELASLAAVAGVVVTSAAAARRLADLGVRTPVAVAPPGTDPAPASPADGAHRLLSVGTVGPRKGQHLAAAALARLGPPWRLRCAGTVAEPVDAALTGPGTTLLGPLGSAALAAEWAQADLHVLLSSAEPYGMAVAEAQARGVPSLVSTAGELPDLVGAAGVVLDLDGPDPVGVVADALTRWAADPALRARTRAAARAARRPTWDDTAAAVAAALTTQGEEGP